MLAGGSTPPWGPGQQYNQLFPVFEGYRDNASGHVSSPNYNSKKTLESLAAARLWPTTSFFWGLVNHNTPNCFTVHTLNTVTYYVSIAYIYLHKLLVHGCTFIWYITYLSPHIHSHLVQPYAHSLSNQRVLPTHASLNFDRTPAFFSPSHNTVQNASG